MEFPRMLYRVGAEGMAYLRVANESDLTDALAGGWHRRRVDAEAAANPAAPEVLEAVAPDAPEADAPADEPKRRGRPRKVAE